MTTKRIKTRISTDILDTIGKSFRFNHGKGVAEWLKNSLDHYLRLYELKQETRSGKWPVFINLIDAKGQSKGPNLAVVDFGGTDLKSIEEFFLLWGDTNAATLGGVTTSAAVTGGHGNGGKFYMRMMWKDGARLSSWRNGRTTSLVVDREDPKTTGYWEFKNQRMDWKKAFEEALTRKDHLGGAEWIINYLENEHPELISELNNQERGFTIIAGRRAEQIYSSNDVVRGGKWESQKLVDDIINAPQVHRPIRELDISLFVNGALRKIHHLIQETVEVDPDWEVVEIPLPTSIIDHQEYTTGISSLGSLRLKKSAHKLTGRRKQLNTMLVTDDSKNPIAYYPIKELPLPGHSSILEFIQAELNLIFPQIRKYVENDRERLVSSPTTQDILTWVADQIWQHVKVFEKEKSHSEEKSELQIAATLNKLLNEHARRFLEELETEILVDFIEDTGGDGTEEAGESTRSTGEGWEFVDGGDLIRDRDTESNGNGANVGPKSRGEGTTEDKPRTVEVPGTTHKVRRPKFPRVLLSSYDPDPAKDDGTSRQLTDRHPPLHQEDEDRKYNIWWLNTSHPFAQESIKRGGADGPWFKSFHLFMFAQVIQLESLRLLQRRQTELGLDIVENELTDMSNRFLADLPIDIVDKLLVN